ITYFLSIRKNNDSHLRGTYANLLAKLIQTTFHLLTLSSLLNSFNNSFINQCLFVSVDSQDSSSHAFTIIRIELLEDSIQHSFVDHNSFLPCQWSIHYLLKWINSFCQWIYKIHHSLQAQASTRIQIVCYFCLLYRILSIFACIVEDTISSIPQTSKINFPPIPGSPQQIKKCFVSSTNDSKNGKDSNNIDNTNSMTSSKDSSTTSNIDKDRKVNRTQLAIVSSSSVETKSSNVSSQVPLNNSLTNIHTITIRQPIIYFICPKKYVNTNESDFQAAVLDLPVQLLLIRHFPTHIINQLEMIEETVAGYDVSSHFIYHISEFLVMLAHDILHSKQFIKALQWLTIIVDSVRNEDDKWKRFSR
ncbi:unnamed protein product, partial [Rotaria sp. Silwood1]